MNGTKLHMEAHKVRQLPLGDTRCIQALGNMMKLEKMLQGKKNTIAHVKFA